MDRRIKHNEIDRHKAKGVGGLAGDTGWEAEEGCRSLSLPEHTIDLLVQEHRTGLGSG